MIEKEFEHEEYRFGPKAHFNRELRDLKHLRVSAYESRSACRARRAAFHRT